MHEYRAYVIGQDGRIELRVDLVCSDDDAARYRARQIANGRYAELWQGVNRIETFEATHQAATNSVIAATTVLLKYFPLAADGAITYPLCHFHQNCA